MRVALALVFVVFSSLLIAEKDHTVIVISMDGMTNDAWDLKELKTFQRIQNEGIRAEFMTPVYQSTTYPGHVSMATGVYPDRHGILHNSFYDRESGFHSYPDDANLIDSPPIWILAEQEGITSGVYFWVGSETQWNGWQAKYKYAPFDANIKEEEKIDQVIAWLDMDEAIRPKLIMTYWDGTDSVGHIYGTDHKKIFDQMVRQDEMLGLLFSRLTEIDAWDYLTLLLVSDHGMINVNKYISLKEVLDSIEINYILSSGPAVAHIFIEDKTQRAQALELLSTQLHIKAYRRENLPASFHMNHPTRTGDLIVTTEPPYMFNNNPLDGPKGMHGYDPDLKEMHAIFGAFGAGVRNERIGPIHMTDVAPTIAKLLGIKSVNHMQGRAIDLSPKD
ncbi:MAG: hypothetical protein CMQ73_05850 [Gammaproteobacteria bacterium]|nr:hypothetical protein [Gammaproteobacteria bacterium]OUT93722.1 MAG: hypothetical protein CBB96_07535 [Gammaproteobacteria bacterium TMED36]|tara:strand:- start:56229 stop:57398 length:1170 start_codon:yes stop_codon:yes gene_type:complete